MSTPKAKLRRTHKRTNAVVATLAATLDGSNSTAVVRSGDSPAPGVPLPSDRNHLTPVNQKRDATVAPATVDPVVLDNLPEVIPVTGSELEVIETYLSSLIDQLLSNATAGRATNTEPTPNPREPVRPSRPRS